MANIPKKTEERLVAGLKRFQPILASARDRDLNEADTVVIVTDILADVFGYDKYSEVTREYAIRSTYCDLGVKIDGELYLLLEVKAIGLELKDSHARQAIDYAANQGADWVVLTNGIFWRVFRVIFGKPIDQELVLDLNLLELSPRNSSHLGLLYTLTREGVLKSALDVHHTQQQATSKFFLGAVVLSDPVLETIRRELRRLSPDVRIQIDGLRELLAGEVIKREVVEGPKADEARKEIRKAASRTLRAKKGREAGGDGTSETEMEQAAEPIALDSAGPDEPS